MFSLATLSFTDPYVLIITASLVLVLSFFFNLVSQRTNIPSVLLLIVLGVLMAQLLNAFGLKDLNFMRLLELLGIVGLIMIVLEAALDLEISQEKLPLIWRSLLVATICLIFSIVSISYIIHFLLDVDFWRSTLYATPLSIMSSAIIIPSVENLIGPKKEFMIYESAFSDILGIMVFYFLISLIEEGGRSAGFQFVGSFFVTIIVAFASSYLIVFIFKDLKSHTRLFLLIAILLILYSAGKLLHLSPLLIILIFGLALANHQLFFKWFKNDWLEGDDAIQKIEKEFHLITLETAFVVRTFFFVIFGMSIELSSLISVNVLLFSIAVLLALYAVRYIVLLICSPKHIVPEVYIAPRGLITILLFFNIPLAHSIPNFQNGILLYVIIISSLVMTFGLIRHKT